MISYRFPIQIAMVGYLDPAAPNVVKQTTTGLRKLHSMRPAVLVFGQQQGHELSWWLFGH